MYYQIFPQRRSDALAKRNSIGKSIGKSMETNIFCTGKRL